ncbi:L-rhamnose mutarotase [Cohnella sp. WQ 127256]|uniref:L-rhamnose mutarotase n=1 Tax=Cohnella sp. WQ 127256 TaxID=2938790 RepID=UPI002118FB68|nr:L-rhamnose mutarotase [Cohnella sp. WQ 127256]
MLRRYGFRLRVKSGHEQDYIYHHEHVIPELIQALKEAGIQNYSIFMDGTDLFAYLECEDIENAWSYVRNNDASEAWDIIMTPHMDLVDPQDDKPNMKPLREVFHLD